MSEAASQPSGGADKRVRVEGLLSDVLKLMEYPATLDFKDMPDGGIGVAVHFQGELPGITPGKRSYLVDCLQFITNKIVNRPNTEKRWVTLGVNAFPEPRPERRDGPPPAPVKDAPADGKSPTPTAGPKASAPGRAGKGQAQSQQQAPNQKTPPKDGREAKDKRVDAAPKQGGAHQQARGPDEATLTVTEDPEVTARGLELFEKSARLGRPYAVLMLSPDDRARMLQLGKGKPGVSVRAEGEAHWRRLAVLPEKLSPMPKKSAAMMHDDEEE